MSVNIQEIQNIFFKKIQEFTGQSKNTGKQEIQHALYALSSVITV